MGLPHPYILGETNWKTVKDMNYEVAIQPWGATEAHNYHLPYATDNYQVEHVATAAASIAWEKDARVVVLPTIPFGINTGQLDIKLCMNLNPSTQMAMLKDIVDVIRRHEIHKFVILNGHGGNHFKNMIRELSFYFPDVFTCSVNWYEAVDLKEYFEDLGDHAGEMETSVMQYIRPDLVLPLSEAGPGDARKYKIKSMREGWISTQRQWSRVTNDTGVGDPSKATPEKGEKYVNACIRKFASFLVELADTDPDALYV